MAAASSKLALRVLRVTAERTKRRQKGQASSVPLPLFITPFGVYLVDGDLARLCFFSLGHLDFQDTVFVARLDTIRIDGFRKDH